MKTLAEVKGRCRIEDGHWIWTGAMSVDGYTRISAPDLVRGGMRSQNGLRAVWQMATGKPIPDGHRVYSLCNVPKCVNPACAACGTGTDMGKHWIKAGVHQNSVAHVLANRKIGRARAKLNPDLIREIQASNDPGLTLAARLDLSPTLVSKARLGQALSFQPVGGFGSLVRRAA